MKKKIEAARQAALEAKNAFDADPSEANLATVEAKAAEFSALVDSAERASKASNVLGLVLNDGGAEELQESTASSFGLASKFFESAEYKSYQAGAAGAPSNSERQVALPSVKLGSYADVIERKANRLTTDLGISKVDTLPMIDQTIREELTLMDLITKGRTDADSLRYAQIVAVTRNAALQPENKVEADDVLKPLSDMATTIETANVFGYADGYTVTTQMLADKAAFATFMDNELRYSIRAIQEEYLLNGTGTNGEPRGILNTTGLLSDTYDGTGSQPVRNLVEKVRTGMRKVRQNGGLTSAILLNPEDNEAIDLMKDANGNYIFGGPANVGQQMLWGRPRVVSEKIDKGTVLLGDFKQVAWMDRDGISVEAFNQHADYARRNLVYVRAEARGMQAIYRPARLLLLEKA